MSTPNPSAHEQKRVVRDTGLRALRAAARVNAINDGVILSKQLLRALSSHLVRGSTWAIFASLPWEIPMGTLDRALDDSGVVRLAPAIVGDELDFRAIPAGVEVQSLPRKTFGVPTPPATFDSVPLDRCSVVISPGVAFGRDGSRVGYGRGFYDRAIESARANGAPHVVGVGFADQLQPTLPTEPHDQHLDAICTPSGGYFVMHR